MHVRPKSVTAVPKSGSTIMSAMIIPGMAIFGKKPSEKLFIFSIIGEELGLAGIAATIALYLIFLVTGVKISSTAKDLFGTYLALGLTFMVTLQALINMAVVLGVLPPKGMPLPFISYGGSSLVVSMIAVGIILNIYIKGNEA